MAAARLTEEAIFHVARQIHLPDLRGDYLRQVCGPDKALRTRVEELLRAHDEEKSFLAAPVGELLATMDEPVREGPGTVVGPYKLLEQIGEGGFGVVFMAEQTQPVRRKVALKVLKPGMDTRQVVARFEAERQALALMDHPNIAHIFDGAETASGRPYFVMELVRGVPITEFCDQNHLPVRQRLELFDAVCQAVQHAHQKGIIHRDLKPSNVLVTLHDDKAVVKVIDFGIAKATGRQLTEKTLFTNFAQLVGTPLYMSPEQAQMSGLDIDTRSDIYSLGVLLYELLTGTTPFDKERLRAAGYDEIRRIIREEEPDRPSTRLSTLGQAAATVSANRQSDPRRLSQLFRGELDWIVMKALEKDRNRRYETASAFTADVRRYLADEPVQACPPSRWYRFRKFARRNKTALLTLTVLTLAALVAAGSLAVSNARISGEAEEKSKALAAANVSAQEAVENLKDALAAVDQMLTRVSEEHLQYVPQMEPVRRELLQDALKFYQKFLARRSDDPALRRETALAFFRVATLHHRLGDYRKAEDAYRHAFAMLNELGKASPLEPAIRGEMISNLFGFAWTLENQGKRSEREKALRRAVALAEDLWKASREARAYRDYLAEANNRLAGAIAVADPKEAEKILRRNLVLIQDTDSDWHRAQTYQHLGLVLEFRRRFLQAEDAYRQALLCFDKALVKSPSRMMIQVDLAETLKRLARVVDANGRTHETEEIYRRAIPLFDQLAQVFPAGPHYRWGQAVAHCQRASHLRKLKRTAEAEQAYRRAVDLLDKLADDFPTHEGYQWTAVDRRREFAEFLVETDSVQEARQVYGEGAGRLANLAAPERAKASKDRGHFYAGLGEWDKAAGDFKKAIDLGSDDVIGVWAPLAILHLRAGRTDAYRSLCEKLLDRFGRKDNPWVNAICTLAPKAVADLSRPVRIAEKEAARRPWSADFRAMLGFALYRQGDMAGAVQRLEASSRFHAGLLGTYPPKLFLAMAYHRLGRGAEAKQLFQAVTKGMEKDTQEVRREWAGAPMQLQWMYQEGMQILRREVEQVLNQDPIAGNDKSEKKQKPD